ncbi:hypothetical protein BKI52_39525 [marine bacterium AO1-C]|nr:hypothetical protein BKI52_39525 [marine bacterium AO1-C]
MHSIQHRFLQAIVVFLCWGAYQVTYAQIDRSNRPQYAVSNISEDLLDGADVVLREDENHLNILNKGAGVFTTSYAITILNESGDRYANYELGYDKLRKINYMRARVFDKNGKYVRTLKKRDIKDYSAADGYSLYSDNRVKYVKMSHNEYPYTILFEYRKTYNGLLFYPSWVPQSSKRMAVEKSEFTIVTPQNLPFRYKEINLEKASKPSGNTGRQTWKIKNLPTFRTEPYTNKNPYSMLLLAPSNFSIKGYTGNMKSWKDFGLWQNKLNAGRQQISPATIQKLKSLTSGLSTTEEKVKKVYEYLQQNTRYVSIQLGIGGWQTFSAEVVDDKGYGDCKALSNYTHSMLKALGIRSHYTLVKAGRREAPIRADFPSNQFNHVILCVPSQKDTVWLECTSQRESFGYLGSFTGDRDVLLITEDGGKVVHTPVYNQSVNTLNRTAQITIDAEGNAKASIQTTYQAIQAETIARLVNSKPDRQKKWLYNNLDIPNFEIEKFRLGLQKGKLPQATETLSLNIRRLASKSGKRLFLKPNLLNRFSGVPKRSKKRKNDIFVPARAAYTDVDSISFKIPEKYHAEYKPAPIQINSDFGSYEMEVIMDAGKMTYIRKMVVKAGTFPKEKYNEMVQFYKKVAKADKEMVVLVSGT